MRSIVLPAGTRVTALARLQGRYDRVYYRSLRGTLKCLSLAPSCRVNRPSGVVSHVV